MCIRDSSSVLINQLQTLMETRKKRPLLTIQKNSFFCNLQSSQKIQLELCIQEKKYKKQEVIWNKDQSANFVIFVQRGELEFFDCPEAEAITDLDVGAFIGDIPAILNDSILQSNLRAITDCSLFVILKQDFKNFLRNNPGLLVLLQNIRYIN
eukprot:TRINITY_DN1084_c0_g1_i2.p1 TRINITY_DN1084_c0_g1~~TRINITY_DN1084_c0_g1_i2.p1  ORF type:complete len:153 (+),score=19.60 TRINITY_DN1084_c0_g1_i2:124-582(+)